MTLDPYTDADLATANLTAEAASLKPNGAARAVDRKLRATASESSAYELDAEAIARVLRKHYGDEAGEVLRRAAAKADAL